MLWIFREYGFDPVDVAVRHHYFLPILIKEVGNLIEVFLIKVNLSRPLIGWAIFVIFGIDKYPLSKLL